MFPDGSVFCVAQAWAAGLWAQSHPRKGMSSLHLGSRVSTASSAGSVASSTPQAPAACMMIVLMIVLALVGVFSRRHRRGQLNSRRERRTASSKGYESLSTEKTIKKSSMVNPAQRYSLHPRLDSNGNCSLTLAWGP